MGFQVYKLFLITQTHVHILVPRTRMAISATCSWPSALECTHHSHSPPVNHFHTGSTGFLSPTLYCPVSYLWPGPVNKPRIC